MFLNLYTANAARGLHHPVRLINPGDDTETFLLNTETTYRFDRAEKVAFGKIEEISLGIFQVHFVLYERSESVGRTDLHIRVSGDKGGELALISTGEFDAENYTLTVQAGVMDLEGVNRIFMRALAFQGVTGTAVSVVNSSIQEIVTKLITKTVNK